jgi:anti-sigma factor RsiW
MEHISDITMIELLGGYVDDPKKQSTLQHISQCDNCQKRWHEFEQRHEFEQTWSKLSELDVDTSDKNLFPKIADNIRSKRRHVRMLPIRTFMRVAASILLAIILGHILGRASTQKTNEDWTLAIARANYLDVLASGSSTGWGEPVLPSNSSESEQRP